MPGLRSHLHLRRSTRVAAAVLALVVGFVQTAWAQAAVCGMAARAHAACTCCEEREAAPRPLIAGDCCAVEETPVTSSDAPVPGVTPPAPDAAPPPMLALAAVTIAPLRAVADGTEIEIRTTGPPLWLRTRSLRL